MTHAKEYKHEYSGITISDELSEEDKKYIKAMYGWKESAQTPMLTEKIILLTKRIERLDKNASRYSKALIVFTGALLVIGTWSLLTTIVAPQGFEKAFWLIIIIVFYIVLGRISKKYIDKA